MFNKPDCRNNSAVVLEKQESLYQEFVKCVTATVDVKQMTQDIRFMLRSIITAMKINSTLSELHTSSLRLYSQRYIFKEFLIISRQKIEHRNVFSEVKIENVVKKKTILFCRIISFQACSLNFSSFLFSAIVPN